MIPNVCAGLILVKPAAQHRVPPNVVLARRNINITDLNEDDRCNHKIDIR